MDKEKDEDDTRIGSTEPVLQTLANDALDATRLVPRKNGSRVLYEFLIWNTVWLQISLASWRDLLLKSRQRTPFAKRTKENGKRDAKANEKKNGKRDSYCDVMKRFSLALLLFSVKAFCLVLGEKDMSRISSLKRTLEHSFLPLWNAREKEQKKQREREHLDDNISISSKSSACASKASFVLHHLHPLKSGRRKRRFGKLRRILSLGQRTMMEKKDDQESQHHRTF